MCQTRPICGKRLCDYGSRDSLYVEDCERGLFIGTQFSILYTLLNVAELHYIEEKILFLEKVAFLPMLCGLQWVLGDSR